MIEECKKTGISSNVGMNMPSLTHDGPATNKQMNNLKKEFDRHPHFNKIRKIVPVSFESVVDKNEKLRIFR